MRRDHTRDNEINADDSVDTDEDVDVRSDDGVRSDDSNVANVEYIGHVERGHDWLLDDESVADSGAAEHPFQSLHPFLTTWHITFGTHAARLHGGPRLTVDRRHNRPGEPFIGRDPQRLEHVQSVLRAPPVELVTEQCAYIEAVIPGICGKGGWALRTCAASPPPDDGDHVHILLDAAPEAEPKVIRELLKRWLTQSLNKRWPPDRTAFQGWWAVGGSTKPVKDVRYLNNAFKYIEKQRMPRRA